MRETIPAFGSKYPTSAEQEILDRIGLARGAWREGQLDNALLILDGVDLADASAATRVEYSVVRATVSGDRGDWSGALDSLRHGAPYLESASARLQGSFFNERARANRRIGRADEALTDYAGAQAMFREGGVKEYEAAVSNNLACLALEFGDLDMALSSADQAIAIYQRLNQPTHVARSLDTKANVLLVQGSLDLALRAIETAMGLQVESEAWAADLYTTRGKIKARLGDFTAKEDFDRALGIAEAAGASASVAAAAAAAIRMLTLPIEDLTFYYRKADEHNSPELRECARIVINALPKGTIEEMEVDMVRRALIKTGGSITRAALLVGLTHKGLDCVVNRHPDQLLHLRKERRRSSIIQNKTVR